MILKSAASEIFLFELELLNHGTHCAVENNNTLVEKAAEVLLNIVRCRSFDLRAHMR